MIKVRGMSYALCVCLVIYMFIYNYIIILLHSLLCFSTDDASRVILSVPDSDGNDYINASFIDVRINFQTYLIPRPASGIEGKRVYMAH